MTLALLFHRLVIESEPSSVAIFLAIPLLIFALHKDWIL